MKRLAWAATAAFFMGAPIQAAEVSLSITIDSATIDASDPPKTIPLRGTIRFTTVEPPPDPDSVVQLPSGATLSQIQNALNEAGDGTTVRLPAGADIAVTSTIQLNVVARDLTLDCNGSRLRQAADARVVQGFGRHPWVEPVEIATAGGVTMLRFPSVPTDLKAGDWIKVVADDPLPGARHGSTNKVRMGQALRIAAIDGFVVRLAGSLYDAALYKTNVRVSPYESGRLRLVNCRVRGDQGKADWKTPLVQVNTAIEPVLDGIAVSDGNSMGIQLVDTINARVTRPDVRNLKSNTANANYGYGVHSGAGIGLTVEGGYFEKVRHAVDANNIAIAPNSSVTNYGAVYDIVVRDSDCVGALGSCWGWHAEARRTLIEDVTATDANLCATFRGMDHVMRRFACTARKGIQIGVANDGEARRVTIERAEVQVDTLGIFISPNTPISEAAARDSRFTACSKPTAVGAFVELQNIAAIDRTDC